MKKKNISIKALTEKTPYRFGTDSGYDLQGKNILCMMLLDTDNNRKRFRSRMNRNVYVLCPIVHIPYKDIASWLSETGWMEPEN